MTLITSIAALTALYGEANPRSLNKVAHRITPLYRQWIGAARFCVLSTVGPEGTDASPRGDDGPVVRVVDDRTLWLPDWRGNNRLDCLRNIVRDGRISLMFMVPGSNNVVRVNGTARLTADPGVTGTFDRRGSRPATVIMITLSEVYFQCAKALMRAGLWSRDDGDTVPTAGQLLHEAGDDVDPASYDATYPDYAASRMW